MGHNTWGSFGIDIALGSLIDKVTTNEEQLFLPEYVFHHFKNALVNEKPLVKSASTLYKSINNNGYTTNILLSPIFMMSIIGVLILFITYRDYRHKRRSKWLDLLIFGFTGFGRYYTSISLVWYQSYRYRIQL